MEYNNAKFIDEFLNIIKAEKPYKILFVSSREYDRFGYMKALESINVKVIPFTNFEPCPEVSSVMQALDLYRENTCDFIVAVGGGSAIDVAKAVKYYGELDVKILAVPSTAGTGAEVTRFSVLYRNADKESVSSFDIIPEYQVLDYTTLISLPRFQRIVTGLDAFCHSVEAYMSINATDESREYSVKSLQLFNENYLKFVDGDNDVNEAMMECSMLAGKAINIARTTAPHALSYKLHKIKGFAHGQAVAVSLVYIWKYMVENADTNELKTLLSQLEEISGYTPESLEKLLIDLGILGEITMTCDEFEETVNGVNVDRLSNHPMKFSIDDIRNIYSSFITV